MTPAEEGALLDSAAASIEASAAEAFADVLAAIRAGAAPRDAVSDAAAAFGADLSAAMAAALTGIMDEAVGAPQVMALQIGGISLSSRLYAEAMAVATDVEAAVQAHARGFNDARRLALDLFEGYGFRPPGAEPLRLSPDNPRLPQYLREALLTDDATQSQLARAFARIQVEGLSSESLRAAYSELLDAIDAVAAGAGTDLLDRRLEVAFYERMRYFATRIARTELHKAYMQREALLLQADADVQFVQVRRATDARWVCVCRLFAGRDLYGLGPGVYPKAVAPLPPYHPFCRCVLSPRLDLTGREAPARNDDGDAYFLRRAGESIAGRIMGSQARADRVMRGESAEDVANAGRRPEHRIRQVGQPAPTG